MTFNGSAGSGRPNFRFDITLGNIISWIVLFGTMVFMYATLSRDVEHNAEINTRQDATLEQLAETLTALRLAAVESAADTRAMREAVQRIERASEAARAERLRLEQERDAR